MFWLRAPDTLLLLLPIPYQIGGMTVRKGAEEQSSRAECDAKLNTCKGTTEPSESRALLCRKEFEGWQVVVVVVVGGWMFGWVDRINVCSGVF